MPSYVTHTLFGQSVTKKLQQNTHDPNVASIICHNAVAFQWGTQGPDILFFKNGFKRAPNPLGDYGAKMHKTLNTELLEAMKEYISKHPDDNAAAAYVLGFICHYCLDSAVHPYIYFLQEQRRSTYRSSLPYGIHMKLETDLDTAVYQEIVGGNIRRYKPDVALITDDLQIDAICRLQSQIIEQVYGGKFVTDDIKPCILNAYKKEKFMFDPTYIKSYLFCKMLELMRGEVNSQSANCRPTKVNYDILNNGHATWYNYRQKDCPRTDSFVELFEGASNRAVKMILAMVEHAKKHQPLSLGNIPTFDDGNPDVFGLNIK